MLGGSGFESWWANLFFNVLCDLLRRFLGQGFDKSRERFAFQLRSNRPFLLCGATMTSDFAQQSQEMLADE